MKKFFEQISFIAYNISNFEDNKAAVSRAFCEKLRKLLIIARKSSGKTRHFEKENLMAEK